MKLRLVTKGRRFTLYAIDQSDDPSVLSCPVMEFLSDLKRSTLASHKTLVAVLKLHADNGPIHNERKSRVLKGSDGIYEFKSRQVDRIAYFYSSGDRGVTILTHGFHKGDNVRVQIRRAENLKVKILRLEELVTNISSISQVDGAEEVGFLDESVSGYQNDSEFIAETMALRFAEEVARRIDARGISRAQLARNMGVSRAYITRILDAPPNLTLQSIAKIALALDMKPELRLSDDSRSGGSLGTMPVPTSGQSINGEVLMGRASQ